MITFGKSLIPCDDIMEMIGKEVVKKRLENCIPTITNVVVENPQTWLACNEQRSGKIVFKGLNNLCQKRPTKQFAYDESILRKEYPDYSEESDDTSDDEIDDEINIFNEGLNNISEDTLYSEGKYCFKSSQSIALSAVVKYPVASTNFLKSATVTSDSSIQKELTLTKCWGYSSLIAISLSAPIKNSPPSIKTIPFVFSSETFFSMELLQEIITKKSINILLIKNLCPKFLKFNI